MDNTGSPAPDLPDLAVAETVQTIEALDAVEIGLRRRCILAPGTGLLLNDSALDAPERLDAFVALSGLDPTTLVTSRYCALPLPSAPTRDATGVRSGYMWHPLMWLPPRLAGRMELPDGTVEDRDGWAIRVSLELTVSGLYDPTSGSWFDVLAAVGIDVDNEVDQARVQDWLDGYPDEALDALSLSEHLDSAGTWWALDVAAEIRPVLREASDALVSNELSALVDAMTAPDSAARQEERRASLAAVGTIGAALLGDAEGVTDPQAFTALRGVADTGEAVAVETGLWEASDLLYAIREQNWSALDDLARFAEEVATTDPSADPEDRPAGEAYDDGEDSATVRVAEA